MSHSTAFRWAILSWAMVFAVEARADDLLYASDGKQLFTVDTQTGALTFVSDGPLQWIASPAFDEEHHTRFWVSGQSAIGVGYYYGNPDTGETGGPYPVSISYNPPPDESLHSDLSLLVYAPTTQQLYSIATIGYGVYVPLLIDQFNRTPIPRWGQVVGDGFDYGWAGSLAFDSDSLSILIAYNGASDGPVAYGVYLLEPLTGQWQRLFEERIEQSSDGLPKRSSIGAIASSSEAPADLYYVMLPYSDPSTPPALYRRSRATGQETMIGELPPGNWSLRFADSKYAQ
ncbi:MAG TPA: hypothetical protein VKU02_30185 [Gemmataceae bacterium]|nr:hypothetical protein [Gemmataceae bacterium]